MTIDEMHELLNELADEIPAEFYRELSGGISLIPDVIYSPEARSGDLLILGAYHSGGGSGRYITMHYGSLMKVYGHLPREEMKKKLWEILRHEMRHHVEALAGNHELEDEDAAFMERYRERQEENS